MTYLLLPTAGVDNDEPAIHSEALENAMDDVHGGVFWTNSTYVIVLVYLPDPHVESTWMTRVLIFSWLMGH